MDGRNAALQAELRRCQHNGKVWVYEWHIPSARTLPERAFYQIPADVGAFREIERDWKVSLVNYDNFQLIIMTAAEKAAKEQEVITTEADELHKEFTSIAPLLSPEELKQ